MYYFRLWILLILWVFEGTLLNQSVPLGLGVLAVVSWQIWIFWKDLKSSKTFSPVLTRLACASGMFWIVLEICWMVLNTSLLWTFCQILYLVFLVLNLGILFYQKKSGPGLGKRVFYLLKVAVPGLVLVLGAFLMAVTVRPALLIRYMQGTNSYSPQNIPQRVSFDPEKYDFYQNIEYASQYPNSFMDIVTQKNSREAPTFFYIHGGGFTSGDKMIGDPNANTKDNYLYVSFLDMLEKGYNVVSINYAFAPEYIYPVAVIQGNEALDFLVRQGGQYGITMNQVIIAGGSSGGYLAAALVTAQLNPEFAASVQVHPVLEKENIQAMILESPALDPKMCGKTVAPDLKLDYVFQTILGAYLGTTSVSPSPEILRKTNLMTKVNADFPPSFLSDGNYGTWPDQSAEYGGLLLEQGIETEVFIPSPEQFGRQLHGYMTFLNTPASDAYFEIRSAFINRLE